MKLYIAPKLKELHRNLMSAEAFKQASLVYRYIITGNDGGWRSLPTLKFSKNFN